MKAATPSVGTTHACEICGRNTSGACTEYIDGDRRRINCFDGQTFSHLAAVGPLRQEKPLKSTAPRHSRVTASTHPSAASASSSSIKTCLTRYCRQNRRASTTVALTLSPRQSAAPKGPQNACARASTRLMQSKTPLSALLPYSVSEKRCR